MLEDDVKDNYYAMFDTHSCHRFRKMHFYARLDINNARFYHWVIAHA